MQHAGKITGWMHGPQPRLREEIGAFLVRRLALLSTLVVRSYCVVGNILQELVQKSEGYPTWDVLLQALTFI